MRLHGSERQLPALAVLLLIIAASRVLRLGDIHMEQDEIWSIWQTFGTVEQIIRWTPYDWTPTHYLILGAWRVLVGIHPDALRMLSVLAFLPGCAFTYRLARRLTNHAGGWLAMLAYAALGYGIFLSLQVRAYAFVYALMPLALWLALRYFYRPGLRRALPLATCLVIIFYLYLPGALGVIGLILLTTAAYGRRVWLWWLPGLLALIPALPEIANKLNLIVTRTQATSQLESGAFLDTTLRLLESYTGLTFVIWLVLLAVGMFAWLYRQRPNQRWIIGLLLWVVVGLTLVYYLNPLLGFLQQPRYSFWVMLGLALLVGLALACLPRWGRAVSGVILAGLMFAPLPLDDYQYIAWPLRSRFEWLAEHIRWGDVLVMDDNCDCPPLETWDYFLRLYFPNGGLVFTDQPADERRIWYVSSTNSRQPEMAAAVAQGRMQGIFTGSSSFHFQLYEAPPDREGILFENGLRFHGFDILDEGVPRGGVFIRREGEPVRLRLWWSADRHIELDYSVGLFLINDRGRVADQVDGPPQIIDAPTETSQWTTDRYYVEERTLTLPATIPNRSFSISLAVYQWWDSVRVNAPGLDEDLTLRLLRVPVKAW